MKIINTNFSNEKLDNYLKNNYGYSYWNFADSIFSIFISYRSRPYGKTIKLTKERISRIEKIKEKFIESIDDFLSEINFYEYSKFHVSMTSMKYLWTHNNKKHFIADKFRVKFIFSVLDEMIKRYNSDVSMFDGIADKIYIKPINLLILINLLIFINLLILLIFVNLFINFHINFLCF